MKQRSRILWPALTATILSCVFVPALWADTAAAPATQPAQTQPEPRGSVTERFRVRMVGIRRQVPLITQAAEAVAKRWVEHPQMLMLFTFGGDTSNFAMEMISRAGGLDNSQPSSMRLTIRTPNDVVVVGPRSWEKGGDFLAKDLAKAREKQAMIVVFGSKAGMPAGMPVDFLIDNGAPDGGEAHAAMNQIVNITNAWVWCCELTSALTRLGHRPAILRGMPLPGAVAHNKEYQRSNKAPELYDWDKPIAAGKLAGDYLDAVEREVTQLEGEANRKQVERAADFCVQKLNAGGTVWAASFTHVLDGEVFFDNKSPIKAFRGISCGPHGETFLKNVKENDLLLYFGEWTLNLPWFDYLKVIRETKAAFIVSFRPGNEPTEPYETGTDVFYDRKVPDALMVLEQHWSWENAVVDLPFPPGKMAPISGVSTCLLYRLLDEAIAAKLAATGR